MMSPEFYAAWIVLVETSSASTKSQEEKQADFGSLLSRYRAHWLITHGKPAQQRSMSKAVFSTWQGHQEAQPGERESSSTSKSASNQLGRNHLIFLLRNDSAPVAREGSPIRHGDAGLHSPRINRPACQTPIQK